MRGAGRRGAARLAGPVQRAYESWGPAPVFRVQKSGHVLFRHVLSGRKTQTAYQMRVSQKIYGERVGSMVEEGGGVLQQREGAKDKADRGPEETKED